MGRPKSVDFGRSRSATNDRNGVVSGRWDCFRVEQLAAIFIDKICYYIAMSGRPFRTAMLSLPLFLCACEGQGDAQEKVMEAPTDGEESVLNLSLADMRATNSSCLISTVSPAVTVFWPDALLFKGESKLFRAGDARFDEIAMAWARAKPKRSATYGIPRQALQLGFRIIDAASSVPGCHERLTLRSPLFDGDFAFVITDVQTADIAGGDYRISIFQRNRDQWQSVAFGSARWGRPII